MKKNTKAPPITNEDTPTGNREQRRSGGNYFRIKQFVEEYPFFKESQIRWILFNRETNGFADCFLKVGKSVLVDGDRFFARVEETRMG